MALFKFHFFWRRACRNQRFSKCEVVGLLLKGTPILRNSQIRELLYFPIRGNGFAR